MEDGGSGSGGWVEPPPSVQCSPACEQETASTAADAHLCPGGTDNDDEPA